MRWSGNDQDEAVDYAESVKADENELDDKGVPIHPIQCREPDMHRESSDNSMHWDVYSKSEVAYDLWMRCQLPPIRDLGLPGLLRLGDAATASASLTNLNTKMPTTGIPYMGISQWPRQVCVHCEEYVQGQGVRRLPFERALIRDQPLPASHSDLRGQDQTLHLVFYSLFYMCLLCHFLPFAFYYLINNLTSRICSPSALTTNLVITKAQIHSL